MLVFFLLQGSDSGASWQASLFFEPTRFEVSWQSNFQLEWEKQLTPLKSYRLSHREQMCLFIVEFTKLQKEFTSNYCQRSYTININTVLQFTGHSLDGSLSFVVNLMLLNRNIVKPSALRSVVTFASPFVFCGDWKIVDYLELDESHVHCVMMLRDIVPRAFSCNYPNHVALVLKSLNGPLPHTLSK